MRKALLGIGVLAVVAAAVIIGVSRGDAPEKQLRAAAVNLIKADTAHVRGTLETHYPAGAPAGLQRFVVEGEGDLRQRDDGTSDAAASFVITASGPGATLTGKGEARIVNDRVFFKVNEVPPLFPSLQELMGRWLALPNIALPQGGFSRHALAESLGGEDVFQDVIRVGRERLGEERMTHLRARLSADGLASVFERMAAKLGRALSDDTKKQVHARLEAVSAIPLELWIDGGRHIRRLQAELPPLPGQERSALTLEFSNFNAPVNIAVPEGAIPLPSAIPSPIPSPLPPAPSP